MSPIDKRAFDQFRRSAGFSLSRCVRLLPEGWEVEYQSAEGRMEQAVLAGRVALQPGQMFASLTRISAEAMHVAQERLEVHAANVLDAREDDRSDLRLLEALVRTPPDLRRILATGFCGRPGYPSAPQDLVGRHYLVLTNARPKPFPALDKQSEGMFLGCESDDEVALLSVLVPQVVTLSQTRVLWRRSTDGRIAVPGARYAGKFFPASLAFGSFPVGWPVQ